MLNVNSFRFNLAINDHPDVAAEVKKVTSGRLPSKESPTCVEISLKTNEVINNRQALQKQQLITTTLNYNTVNDLIYAHFQINA